MAGLPVRTLMPHDPGRLGKKPRSKGRSLMRTAGPIVIPAFLLALALFSLPSILSVDAHSQQLAMNVESQPFPISVDPQTKSIVESPTADALLQAHASGKLGAALEQANIALAWIANLVESFPLYRLLAGTDVRFVVITPGFRQEQVADAFGSKLGWNTAKRALFLKSVATVAPTLSEGEFVPGTYEVHGAMTPSDVHNMLAERFANQILARYPDATSAQVPLRDALTIASLIERETGGTDDMRMISGIIWNRLFVNMNLQIDATLQYAKSSQSTSWWPPVVPKDKYISSKYNTYSHKGLPPSPIANPSVAAVIAAINPKPTDCIFYFHDSRGEFHCSANYKTHVSLLKKYYGQGK